MYIAFRLKQGRDGDIIAWLESLEPGDRSYYIRQAIKQGLNNNLPAGSSCPEINITPKQAEEIKQVINEADLEQALDNWL